MCHNFDQNICVLIVFMTDFFTNLGTINIYVIAKRKKLPEDLKRLQIAGHRSGNGYDRISKHFGIQYSSSSRNNAIFKAAKSVANPK